MHFSSTYTSQVPAPFKTYIQSQIQPLSSRIQGLWAVRPEPADNKR